MLGCLPCSPAQLCPFASFFYLPVFFSFLRFQLVRETNVPTVALLGRSVSTGEFCRLSAEGARGPLSPGGFASGGGAEVVKVPGVLIVKLDGALHFANAGAMQRALERIDKFSHAHAHPASTPRPFFPQTVHQPPSQQPHPLPQPPSRLQPQAQHHPPRPHSSSKAKAAHGQQHCHGSSLHLHLSPSPPAAAASGSASGTLLHPCVILDLSDCTSVDSTAVLTLLSVMSQYVCGERQLTLLLVMQRASLHDRIVRAAGADRYATGVFRQLSSAVDYAQNEAQQVEPEPEPTRLGYESFSNGPASR